MLPVQKTKLSLPEIYSKLLLQESCNDTEKDQTKAARFTKMQYFEKGY